MRWQMSAYGLSMKNRIFRRKIPEKLQQFHFWDGFGLDSEDGCWVEGD